MQVSPAEIEDVLLDEPSGIVQDVAVAGVQTPGARTSDDRSPRAWIVLSTQGQQMPERQAREALIEWVEKNLSKYKWLRGGIQFVQEASDGGFRSFCHYQQVRFCRFLRIPQACCLQV